MNEPPAVGRLLDLTGRVVVGGAVTDREKAAKTSQVSCLAVVTPLQDVAGREPHRAGLKAT